MTYRQYIFASAIITFPCLASAQTNGLTNGQIAILNQCVDNLYNSIKTQSVSTCTSKDLYLSAGPTSDNCSITTLQPPAHYDILSGSAFAATVSGACTYASGARIASNTVACVLYTAGCGLFNGGGNIWARCGSKVQYNPQIVDMIQIKKYCLGQLFGVSLQKPGSNSISCVLTATGTNGC
jgi:hypothetical protein